MIVPPARHAQVFSPLELRLLPEYVAKPEECRHAQSVRTAYSRQQRQLPFVMGDVQQNRLGRQAGKEKSV